MAVRPAVAVSRPALRSPAVYLQAEPAAPESASDGLPEGWAAATDDEGSTYYWNKETKETTWQRPGTAPVKDAAGNVYDDETTQDDGPDFSNSMRQKMIDESRGFGADPGSKNPFLAVFAGVGVFVVLGALAVNM